MPDAFIRTFHRGKLDSITLDALNFMHDHGIRFDMPIEDYKTDFPHNTSTTNSLRFLIEPTYFREDYVYITDVDFVFLAHEPPINEYYIDKCRAWKQPYWARRGFKRIIGTDERAKRIAGGGVLVTLDWWLATEKLRERYLGELMDGTIGQQREDDEIMLWYLCAGSGMKCPTKRGNRRRKVYKEIHCGDFKFSHRWTKEKKMKKKISKGNYLKWHRLEEDPVWRELVDICSKCDMVKGIIDNIRSYMSDRKTITFED